MARKRKYILLLIPVAVAVVVTLVVNAEMFPDDYSYQRVFFGPNDVQAEILPVNSHIAGYILAERPFSVYVISSNSGYFEGNSDNVLMSWENVTNVTLSINVPRDGYYLVIKNGNVSQEIEMRFRAER
ncbi:multidrug transporter [Thermococcus sp. MAR1]|nr:multidrug transporter [Thermococcus sp. MAR1]